MEIISSSLFDAWLGELKDRHAQRRILYAIARCEAHGRMIGDIKPVGEKVSEMRFHFGPGYRVYYTRLGAITVSCWPEEINPARIKIFEPLKSSHNR